MILLSFYNISTYSSILMWVRVITQFLGFSLISFSYFIVGKYQGTNLRNNLISLLGTMLLLLSAFGILFLFFNPLELVTVYSSTSIFTVFNLALLSYITIFLFRKIKFTNGIRKSTPTALLAFFCLWIGQLTFLIYSVAVNDTAILIGSQVARIVGFAFLIQIYYSAKKEALAYSCDQAK